MCFCSFHRLSDFSGSADDCAAGGGNINEDVKEFSSTVARIVVTSIQTK